MFYTVLFASGQVDDADLGFELARGLIRGITVVGVRDNIDLSEEGINKILSGIAAGGEVLDNSILSSEHELIGRHLLVLDNRTGID